MTPRFQQRNSPLKLSQVLSPHTIMNILILFLLIATRESLQDKSDGSDSSYGATTKSFAKVENVTGLFPKASDGYNSTRGKLGNSEI